MSVYFAAVCRSSVSPQALHFHVSSLIPANCMNESGCGIDDVLLTAGSPQAGQGAPCCFGAALSSAAKRRSNSSVRAGASRIFFHSDHRSSDDNISWSSDNAAS